MILRLLSLAISLFLLLCACGPKEPTTGVIKIGLVTDVGGRGDQSFNDGALRGLEMWAAGKVYTAGGYREITPEELAESVPESITRMGIKIEPLGVVPVVLLSQNQTQYEANIETLVEEGVKLIVCVGFMLEPAVRAAAPRHPHVKFLLIDSPLLDKDGKPYTLPNVQCYTFLEHEGSFLVGALAGLVTKTNIVGFVGGMRMPLIKKFEIGYHAGLMTTNPEAAKNLLVGYTGTFDNTENGRRLAVDQLDKGADVIYHAAGIDGLGVIRACEERGKFAIGVDSDQYHVAPGSVLTSMMKHVDLCVYICTKEVVEGRFEGKHVVLGLKDGGLGYAPVRLNFEGKEEALKRVEALRRMIIEGELVIPSTEEELEKFTPPEIGTN